MTKSAIWNTMTMKVKAEFWAHCDSPTFISASDGLLEAYECLDAAQDVLKACSRAQYIVLLYEVAEESAGIMEVLKNHLPATVLLALLFGDWPVEWVPDKAQREAITKDLFGDDGPVFAELSDILSDSARLDPKIAAEEDRRWALTGRDNSQ